MTLGDFFRLTRRRAGTIIVCVLVGVAAAAGLLAILPNQYTSHATAYVRVSVAKSSNGAADSNAYYSASQLAGQKVKAFVPVFTSESVAQAVITQLGLHTTPSAFISQVDASNATNALTIDVSATGDSPEQSRRIADAVVNQSAAQIRTLEGAGSPVQVLMMAPASLSNVDQSPSVPLYILVGVVAGLFVGYVVAFTRQRFDTRLRTADDIDQRFDIPLLAVLPQSKAIARTDLDAEPDFQAEESVRKLRTNLRYADVDHEDRVIVVTSPLQGDGKSSVAARLARVMALAGQDVLLIDADLRRPSVADTYNFKGPHGLSQVLVRSAHLESAIRATDTPGLSALPSFGTPPNPSELLGSTKMTELIRYLSRDRVLVLDAPPVLPVTDAVILSKAADSVVVVVSAGTTRAEQLDHALAAIERGKGRIAGVVLNRAASSKLARLRYGDSEYGYGYSESAYDDGGSPATPPTPDSPSPAPAAQEGGAPAAQRSVPSAQESALTDTRRLPVIAEDAPTSPPNTRRSEPGRAHGSSKRLRRAAPSDD